MRDESGRFHPSSLIPTYRRRFFGGAFLVCLPLDFCGLLLAFGFEALAFEELAFEGLLAG